MLTTADGVKTVDFLINSTAIYIVYMLCILPVPCTGLVKNTYVLAVNASLSVLLPHRWEGPLNIYFLAFILGENKNQFCFKM